ncbi:MAG: imidazole glycerol phosphate synthase subunit HisH [Deltaproteobacteria bacterium]|nr:imidazole glycerol phosphate synthase subunit HisH [Deltaproteobacteria bacterium]
MIAVVDYGAGNVASVVRALRHLGGDAQLVRDPEQLLAARQVVFPGQGHFAQAMRQLQASGMLSALVQTIDRGKPFLGICLGLQLLYQGSDEAPGVAGLGLLPGHCQRFAPGLPVPHVGWQQLRAPAGPHLRGEEHTSGLESPSQFYYFVHSYYAPAQGEAVTAVADYGVPFAAAVRRDNLCAVQFHPEKSGQAGLDYLAAWLKLA